ncbi:hypothetical protein J1605_011247 [Eschrichtius robustus]|uniref:Uncharacterized protein n=1 Tax=Eschrichtius robustus TaxID=9764 RepID=A0AB34GMK1_ESCRO|nr:hypothetical protein J1605_011247 [Eschrichtius robustus]
MLPAPSRVGSVLRAPVIEKYLRGRMGETCGSSEHARPAAAEGLSGSGLQAFQAAGEEDSGGGAPRPRTPVERRGFGRREGTNREPDVCESAAAASSLLSGILKPGALTKEDPELDAAQEAFCTPPPLAAGKTSSLPPYFLLLLAAVRIQYGVNRRSREMGLGPGALHRLPGAPPPTAERSPEPGPRRSTARLFFFSSPPSLSPSQISPLRPPPSPRSPRPPRPSALRRSLSPEACLCTPSPRPHPALRSPCFPFCLLRRPLHL